MSVSSVVVTKQQKFLGQQKLVIAYVSIIDRIDMHYIIYLF